LSLGPLTSEKLRSHGITVALEASKQTLDTLVAELVKRVQEEAS